MLRRVSGSVALAVLLLPLAALAAQEAAAGPPSVVEVTARATVHLEPGRYAWIVEAPADRASAQTFTVE